MHGDGMSTEFVVVWYDVFDSVVDDVGGGVFGLLVGCL